MLSELGQKVQTSETENNDDGAAAALLVLASIRELEGAGGELDAGVVRVLLGCVPGCKRGSGEVQQDMDTLVRGGQSPGMGGSKATAMESRGEREE